MDEDAKAVARVYILIVGVAVLMFVFCYGSRQLALLEDRITREARYELLEQELVELSEEGLEEFFFDD
jgi:hypothetical protein